MSSHLVYSGGYPRGNYLNFSQRGGGFWGSLLQKAKNAVKKAAPHVQNKLAQEVQKTVVHTAQGLLGGKDLKTAVKDGSLKTVNNLMHEALHEVKSRVSKAVGLPDHQSQGLPQKRKLMQQAQQLGPPLKKKKKGLAVKRTVKGKKKTRRGGSLKTTIFDR